MTRREWRHVAVMVLTAAVVLFAFALGIRGVSDTLGLLFLYAAALSALAGVVIIARIAVLLSSRGG